MNKKLIWLHILNDLISVCAIGAALFWSAGRTDWPPAWAAMAVWLVWFTAMDVLYLRFNPDLMTECIRFPKGAKGWDRTLMSIVRLSQLARYILAGLDVRHGWTKGFPPAVQGGALVLCFLCVALFMWAMASNPFFSQIVRIQTDRGHMVVSGGPYRFVRHPGYAGLIVFEFALSALFGSWPAIAAGGFCALLFILRTALEDQTLQAELAGYADYARRVRYRLLPGVW
jgi:protein-S-isoprenylcysteine O-methyltransferase Ste14